MVHEKVELYNKICENADLVITNMLVRYIKRCKKRHMHKKCYNFNMVLYQPY